MKNDYYDIAYSDYQYITLAIKSDLYNCISVQAEQVVEKLLKSVLELVYPGVDKQVLNGHNLRKIYLAIEERTDSFNLNVDSLGALKDIYFDGKYPGDNFIVVTKDMCASHLRIMLEVIRQVNSFREMNGLYTYPFSLTAYSGISNLEDIVKDDTMLIRKYIKEEDIEDFKNYIPTSIEINDTNISMLAKMYTNLRHK